MGNSLDINKNQKINTYLDLCEFQDIKNNILVYYLNPVDVSILTSDKELFEKVFIYKINERLMNIFQDKYEQFRKNLNDNNLLISGSFILQCILGERWDSDLDIITIGQTGIPLSYPATLDFLKENGEHDVHSYLSHRNISYIKDYMNNDHKIQLIYYCGNALNK